MMAAMLNISVEHLALSMVSYDPLLGHPISVHNLSHRLAGRCLMVS